MQSLQSWLKANRALLGNAMSLIGTTGVSSVMGFAFWWVAARYFPRSEVGFASASVSAMMFLGAMAKFGVGAWLIGQLSRQPEKTKSLMLTGAMVNGILGLIFGALFALIAPLTSADFAILHHPLNLVLFAIGVAVCAIAFVMDEAVIGLLRGDVQLTRNIFFAASKLLLLFGAGAMASGLTGLGIYGLWFCCEIASLAFLLRLPAMRDGSPFRLDTDLLRGLGKGAVTHHMTNLAFDSPKTLMPVLVTMLLSADTNASFYVAWMIIGFVVLLPAALTSVLYAVGAAQPALLRQKMRTTLLGSTLAASAAFVGIMLTADLVLGLFGSDYARQAAPVLRLLTLAAFPLIIKFHYLAINRIYDRLTASIPVLLIGVALELALAILGARLGGLIGLSAGWVLANYLQVVFMLRPVINVYQGENLKPMPN